MTVLAAATVAARAEDAAPPPAGAQLRYRAANLELARLYQAFLATANPGMRQMLNRQEAGWLAERDRICFAGAGHNYVYATALTRAQSARIAAQLGLIASPARVFATKSQGPAGTASAMPKTLALAVPPHALPARDGDAGLYTVSATSMPWLWRRNGVNGAFAFGLQDGGGPEIVALSQLKADPGDRLSIKYIGGRIDVGPGSPPTDAAGYAGSNDRGRRGITGLALPSAYISAAPVNLGALIGVFADQSGVLIGAPFAIGTGPIYVLVPTGAGRLQLGINDDIFGDKASSVVNSGSFTVLVALAPMPAMKIAAVRASSQAGLQSEQ